MSYLQVTMLVFRCMKLFIRDGSLLVAGEGMEDIWEGGTKMLPGYLFKEMGVKSNTLCRERVENSHFQHCFIFSFIVTFEMSCFFHVLLWRCKYLCTEIMTV